MTKILVVEDEPDIRELLADLMHDAGYDVVEASDGRSALEKACAERPDIVLLDLVLPLLDGFEVLERLKSRPATRTIPVIVVSARQQGHQQERARNAGAFAYITKPWRTGELESKVKDAEMAGRSPSGAVGNVL